MARFWPKSRYNGRVMAREVFFYQCLWVTKFCAKFGCSRTPRTASVPNSFIVLRCMWKEPAPLAYRTGLREHDLCFVFCSCKFLPKVDVTLAAFSRLLFLSLSKTGSPSEKAAGLWKLPSSMSPWCLILQCVLKNNLFDQKSRNWELHTNWLPKLSGIGGLLRRKWEFSVKAKNTDK